MSGELASLMMLLVLNEGDDSSSSSTPSLSTFAREISQRLQARVSLAQVVTSYSQSLVAEEAEIGQTVERCQVARDKLLAELHRIEAQLSQAEKRRLSVTACKQHCRQAINAIASGAVKPFVAFDDANKTDLHTTTPGMAGLPASHSVELPQHLTTIAPLMSNTANTPFQGSRVDSATRTPAGREGALDMESLVAVLSLGDVREGPLQTSLVNFEAQCAALLDSAWSDDELTKVERVVDALVAHVPHPRPPIQQLELRVLGLLSKRKGGRALPFLQREGVIHVLVRLLHSVNDDVKAEALDSLNQIVCTDAARSLFSQLRGVEPIVAIVSSSTNEFVLERALVFLWGLLSSSDALRSEVRQLGGLRAVLDLLYTDSMPILENVAMSIGYITREEESKIAIRDGGGLEKITATLRHPSESIQTKIAGAIWNCASNNENRALLRQLGCIPALIELVGLNHEHVQENAAGALWNLSVDADNKTQILDYGGIAVLIRLLQSSESPSVIENATGTLWNCSAMLENRAAIRKCGGIVPLVRYLRSDNEKIQDNCAGALRNCAINDQNKTVIREAGGVELVFELLTKVAPTTQDKLIAMLWILTAAPEVKHAVRLCGGLTRLVQVLKTSPLQIQEKIIGVLRNCATEAANRQTMIDAGVISVLVDVATEHADRISPTAKEATASAIWYLCRDDKTTARKEGGLRLMCRMLHDPCTAVVEHAAGALSSLTITVPENRDAVREDGGFQKLLELLVRNYEVSITPPGQQPRAGGQLPVSFAYALMNVLLSIRNATSANETNMKIAASYPDMATALVFIVTKGAEEYAKEAALCVKNLSLDRNCVEEMIHGGAVAALTSLAERGTTDAIRKAAAMALQSVTRYGGAHALRR